MAFDLGQHIKETTSTTGTGAFTLAAAAGFLRFSSQIANGNTVIYSRWNSVPDIEVGVGTYNANVITPLHPTPALLFSTNGGGLVSWTGTQNVACGLPMDIFLYLLDPAGALGLVERTAQWPPAYAAVVMTTLARNLLGDASQADMLTRIAAMQQVLTTRGDIVRAGASGIPERHALGANGYYLGSDGTDALFKLIQSTHIAITTPTAPLTATDLQAMVVQAAGFFAALQALTAAAPFMRPMYVSAAQTITSGGTLTLAHGLVVKPNLVVARLTCVTGELGYVTGDTVELGAFVTANGINQGHSIRTNTTNLLVQFGGATNVYNIHRLDGTTGNTSNLTNANWTIRFSAFA